MLLYIYLIYLYCLYIYIFIYLYSSHLLCAYTISRFGSKVLHTLKDHIESYLRNHDLPAPDAERSRKPKANAERCLAIVFTMSISWKVFPTQHCSFLNSYLYQKSQVVPQTFRHYNQSELHTIHQVLLNMIGLKEKRGLVDILNYADSIFPQCLFYSNLSYFLSQKLDILGLVKQWTSLRSCRPCSMNPLPSCAKRRTLDSTSREC